MDVEKKLYSVQSYLNKVYNLIKVFFESKITYKLDKNIIYLDKNCSNYKSTGIYIQKYSDSQFLIYPNDCKCDTIPVIELHKDSNTPEYYYYIYTTSFPGCKCASLAYTTNEIDIINKISRYIFDYNLDSFKHFFQHLIVKYFI